MSRNFWQITLTPIKHFLHKTENILHSHHLTTQQFSLVVALFTVALYNATYFKHIYDILAPLTLYHTFLLIELALIVFLLVHLLFHLFCLKYVTKPLFILLFMINAPVMYFMSKYNIVIDKEMLINVVETNIGESKELLLPSFFIHIFIFGILPSLWVYSLRFKYQPFTQKILKKLIVIGITAILLVIMLFSSYNFYASFFRNHSNLRDWVVPLNYLYALTKVVSEKTKGLSQAAVVENISFDATYTPSKRKKLIILVVGETARASNFSLGGYNRPTNVPLTEKSLLYFENVSSCGTTTAVSVPCMFSDLTRHHYDKNKAVLRENILDILQKMGVSILWRENNSDCKGVCKRLPTENLLHAEISPICTKGECFDDILFTHLQEKIIPSGDQLIVFHQKGSHGPSYYKRYPKAFDHFKPACGKDDLQACSSEEIQNSYDNTIVYTSHILQKTIDFLKGQKNMDTALIYFSDHGESLGEHGLYLHGMPYIIAPKEQTHIPAILWFSPHMEQTLRLNKDCLRNNHHLPYSHDNLFHTLLGLFNVKTRLYEKSLDMLAPCRQQ